MLLVVCGFTSRRGNTQAFALMAGTSTAYRVAAFIGRSYAFGDTSRRARGDPAVSTAVGLCPRIGAHVVRRGDTGSPE